MLAPDGHAACIFNVTVSCLATAAFFCCGSQPASNPPATTAPVAAAALVINFLLEEVFKLL